TSTGASAATSTSATASSCTTTAGSTAAATSGDKDRRHGRLFEDAFNHWRERRCMGRVKFSGRQTPGRGYQNDKRQEWKQ
ncbi:MAG: hypothetical protein WB818_19845, partial [Desulfobacterales bacterium]